ncbi:hypothetical protein FNV43_RR11824 [Rhamnella rubrinervis]|uniref:HSF-type DNA-binding domain-containing protein n=1 Tax=Rhamnella rubrinervis TaxID=2594499 RepID=A0A8K0MHN5_9ROSA|nr:hypothetical protein FNV43_RR11824 [Rhamnella rubrinervis]
MALMLDNCEGILLSLDSHKSVPAPFLTKTYQLVDDPTTDHIVSWGEDDTTFVVWRPPEFARDLLPNYFKHNNFSSFVRQLNTYGFRKIVPDRWEFANEFFKKGEKHLLCEIHRRKTAQPQVAVNHHHHHHHPHSPLGVNGPSFFPFSSRVSISPSDSDEQPNWVTRPALITKRRHDWCFGCGSSVTILEEPTSNGGCKTKLFGVPLHSKKRLHPEYGPNPTSMETNKARFVLEKDDLGLNLMPPSTC